RVEVHHGAERTGVVGMLWREKPAYRLLPRRPIHEPFHSLRALLPNDLSYSTDVRAVGTAERRGHSVGLQPERHLELVPGNRVEIVCDVLGGARPVAGRAPSRLQQN